MVWRKPSFNLRFNRVPQNCHESIFVISSSWPKPPTDLHDIQPFSLTHHLLDSKPTQMEKPFENCRSVSFEPVRTKKHNDHDDDNNASPSSKVTELRRAVSSTHPKVQRHEEGKIVEENEGEEEEKDEDFDRISEEFDQFVNDITNSDENPPEIPDCFEKFMAALEERIKKWNSGECPINWCQISGEGALLLEDLDKVCKLNQALSNFSDQPNYMSSLGRTGIVLQRVMSFLEEEFRSLLEDSGYENVESGSLRCKSSSSANQEDRGSTPTHLDREVSFPIYPPEILSQLAGITKTMISAGYDTECCQVYSISRRHFFSEILTKLGVEKISIEDVQKMQWDDVEGEITKWIKAFKICVDGLFIGELKLCESVYSDHPEVSKALFCNLTRGVLIQLLNFAEAIAITKRSTEKLFKFLDMYEALREVSPKETLFPDDILLEISSAKSRLGGAAVGAFADFVNSIQGDAAKQTVPGGAVHPITRYVMNYLKYACAYKDTLEQLYREHDKKATKKKENSPETDPQDESSGQQGEVQHQKENPSPGSPQEKDPSPFSNQLMTIMGLLASNIDSKSKLYKDLSLSYIFLMNNGRYIVQKIKGSEIYDLLGDTWYRQKSTDLRQYHKNYQRETWSKVLGCFKDEGLQVKGVVSKPILKERFKSFNTMFDEIHRTQSCWTVSDDQLQSELRVSISAVVIPAYRSFLGRFKQYLDSGRQSEKYIKYAPEDLETYIDELFEGTPASFIRRKT